jgi:hypothetical protein
VVEGDETVTEMRERVMRAGSKRSGSWAWLLVAALVGCSSDVTEVSPHEPEAIDEPNVTQVFGSFAGGALSLELGRLDGLAMRLITVTIEGPPGFTPQTHELDAGDGKSVSIFFGELLAGQEYRVTLRSGDCEGRASFIPVAGRPTQLAVPVVCPTAPPTPEAAPTGNAQVSVTVQSRPSQFTCDHIVKLVASPAVQRLDGNIPTNLELFLESDVRAPRISWDATGGQLSEPSSDGLRTTLRCTAPGNVTVAVAVTASETAGRCTDGTVAIVECRRPAARCGDGIISTGEVCDGAALPTGAPSGSACAADCSRLITLLESDACSSCTERECGGRVDVCAPSRGGRNNQGAACSALVDCVQRTGCSDRNLVECYCGDRAQDDCTRRGPGAGADCGAEFTAASGCAGRGNECVAPRFRDTNFSVSWIFEENDCQHISCAAECGLRQRRY